MRHPLRIVLLAPFEWLARDARHALGKLIPLALCLALGVPAAAQTSESAADLRRQIASAEKVADASSTPEAVRSFNAGVLADRRARLRELLEKEVAGLRQYRASDFLTAAERERVDETIEALREEADALGSGSAPAVVARVDEPAPVEVVRVKAEVPSVRPPLAAQPPMASPMPARLADPADTQVPESAPSCYEAPTAVVEAAWQAAGSVLSQSKNAEMFRFGAPKLFLLTLAHRYSMIAGGGDPLARLSALYVEEETFRTDKQIGASARSEGSTTVAEKPGFASLLGLAVEHGAVQQEVDDTTLTLSTSPYAIVAAVQGDTPETYADHPVLTRIGASASFSLAEDSDESDVLANARRNQLGEWSVRFRLSPDRSIRSAEFQKFLDADVRPAMKRLATSYVNALGVQFQGEVDQKSNTIQTEIVAALKPYIEAHPNVTRGELTNLILCLVKAKVYDEHQRLGMTPEATKLLLEQSIPDITQAEEKLKEARALMDAKIDEMRNRSLYTFAYTNVRQPDASDYSVLKFLFERGVFDNKAKLVANAGLSLYHHPIAAMNQQTVRDFAAAVSIEGTAGRSPFLGAEEDKSRITYAFTGRYQRLLENRHVMGKSADIAVAQFRLEIPFATGVSFPVSVSVANATEFIKEDHVRANFGFSFDADKLLLVRKLVGR
jgi:hypothetical protein